MSISHAITPLRMIFWGGLLCVFDFSISHTTSINGRPPTGFSFDILNDFVGMLLITIGVSRLSAFALDASYGASMRFVFVCAVLNSIQAFSDHFIFYRPGIILFAFNALGIASLCASVLFCTSMCRLSSAHGLSRSADSWRITRILVIALWCIPRGLSYLAAIVSIVTGRSFHISFGVFGIPLLLLFIVPWVHLFLSTSRMRDEAHTHPTVPVL